MTAIHAVHPCSNIDQLYLPRDFGGQGLVQGKLGGKKEGTEGLHQGQQRKMLAESTE